MVYTLPDLKYDYNALAPAISAEIVELHHGKHHAAYVAGANAAQEQLAEARAKGNFGTINKLLKDLAFHLGGHLNHAIYWDIMSPDGGGEATGDLAVAIGTDFGSFAAFQGQFNAAANGVQGSGWAMLVFDTVGQRLNINQVYDHQSNLAPSQIPVLLIDMWEHAFYLQYKNVKASYVTKWWDVVDWNAVADRYAKARQAGAALA